jgi:fructose-1-phosphate kinase PfkB-like protein
VAGLVADGYAGRDDIYGLRFGVACGAVSRKNLGAGQVEQREVERLLPEVSLEQLGAPAVSA